MKLTCNEQNNCTSKAARWWNAGSEERAQFTDYMAHDYRSSKQREIGCEVRKKKSPSKTTPKHSLNLCNGYAAGNWANLPCKESPFCTQHFKGVRNWVSGSQWARGEGGMDSAMHICLPEWRRLAGGVQNERFSWCRAKQWFSQHHCCCFRLQKNSAKP